MINFTKQIVKCLQMCLLEKKEYFRVERSNLLFIQIFK